MTIIQRTTTTPGTAANNVIVIADYFLSSGTEKCGPQTITGHNSTIKIYINQPYHFGLLLKAEGYNTEFVIFSLAILHWTLVGEFAMSVGILSAS